MKGFQKIRILLVDDQTIIRQGLVALLNSAEDIEVVGTASNGHQAVEQVKSLQPDVALIDIEMPGTDGVTTTRAISNRFPETKVVILSGHNNEKYIVQSIQAGAKTYLLKSTLAEDLKDTIRYVHKGYSQLESGLLEKVIAGAAVSNSFIPHTLSDCTQNTSLKQDEPDAPRKLNISKQDPNIEMPFAQSREASDLLPSTNADLNMEPSIEKLQPTNRPSFRSLKWLVTYLLLAVVLFTSATTLYNFFLRRTSREVSPSTVTEATPPAVVSVAALGRIQPKTLITLSSSSELESATVSQILVKEGELVQRGQVIAILGNINQVKSALEQAKINAKVAQAQLAKVKAGEAKRGEIAAQEMRIGDLEAQFKGEIAVQKPKVVRLEAEFKNAQQEYTRYQYLYREGSISESLVASKLLVLETFQEEFKASEATLKQLLSTFPYKISEAKATLEQLKEVRLVDVQVAQTELEQALAAVRKAEADLELAYVRASVDGLILKIHTFAGESIDSNGIVDLAQTKQMYVVAEVYETDINKIRLGQRATASSSALTKNLKGTVEQIGSRIGKKGVFNSDPTLDIDARVVEIKIKLDPVDNQQTASLINLQVEVEIDTNL